MDQRLSRSLVFLFVLYQLIIIRATECNRHSLANKRFIDQLQEGQYEIVHPFQMREKSRERIGIDTREHFLNTTPVQHFRHVNIVVRSSVLVHQRLRLSLALNEHLFGAKNRLIREMGPTSEDGQQEGLDGLENCFYQGSIGGEPGSLVAMSTCEGLWGLIAFPNGTALGIWPLKGGDRGRRHPHVLFRTGVTDTKCGTAPQHGKRRRRGGEAAAPLSGTTGRPKLFLELALIGDSELMGHFNRSRRKAAEYTLSALNTADLLLRRGLNVRLTASFVELWADDAQQRVEAREDVQRMLSGLLDYTTAHLYAEAKDATLLLTGHRWFPPTANSNDTKMAAVAGSVCSRTAPVGVVQVVDPFSPHQTALSLAHTIGHLLGLEHDESASDCGCPAAGHCVMANPLGPSALFGLHFSACSTGRLLSLLGRSPGLQCLLHRPSQSAHHSSAARLFLCGNGQLDEGEECDCGRRDQDPCCDPLSCQLRAHAQCAAHQTCCHGCQLRPAGQPCRPSRSVCDVPETCDGVSADCPADGHLLDGIACGLGGQGQCWQGQCRDGEAQCRQLWGNGARLADQSCFGQNGRGLEYGHCGTDAEGHFVACAPENQRCGLLHCREGAASPTGLLPSNATSFALQFASVQCKVVTNSPLGLVQEGTSCGPGRVCLQAVCLPLAQLSPPVQCPSDALGLQCSDHGDCTTSRHCLCFDGWTGPACESRMAAVVNLRKKQPGDGRQQPELASFGPGRFAGRALETATLLAILAAMGLLLLLLLVCLLLFYRRKSSTDSARRSDTQLKSADEECLSGHGEEVDGVSTGRAIKFGQMPSWREEKRKWKTNKRVYDALQRITEANEADSMSLKSRESSSVAAANGTVFHPIGERNNYRPGSAVSPPPPNPQSVLHHSPPAPYNGGSTAALFTSRDSAEGLVLLGRHVVGSESGEECDGGDQQLSTAPFGPRLANISLLMRTLDGTTSAIDVTEETRRPIRAPASADSGHAGSSLDIRESPSLFSDPYRLDLPG